MALVVCCVVLGCEPVGRARECRRLAALVDAALSDVEKLDIKAAAPTKLRSAAKRYDVLAGDLGDLGFRSELIAKEVAEYRRMFTETARSLRTYADAAEKQDSGTMRRARHELDRLVRREKLSVLKIDGHCSGHH